MIEITDGFTDISIGTDPIADRQWRDPLTASRVPTGVRVTLNFRRLIALPERTAVRVRYDLAENGCEREAQGIPRLTHTQTQGDAIFHHYRMAYWMPPSAAMQFLPNVRQRTEALISEAVPS